MLLKMTTWPLHNSKAANTRFYVDCKDAVAAAAAAAVVILVTATPPKSSKAAVY